MGYGQGDVWWGPAPQKSSPAYRPWLIVNDASHPFAAEECIAVGMTTQTRDEAIPMPDDEWIRGGSRTEAYVSPWYVTTIKQRDFDNHQGELSESVVADVVDALHGYTAPPIR
jgi:hypothetical protein